MCFTSKVSDFEYLVQKDNIEYLISSFIMIACLSNIMLDMLGNKVIKINFTCSLWISEKVG